MKTGYLSKNYIEAFKKHGPAVHLSEIDSYVIQEQIPESDFSKFKYVYPMFSAPDFNGVALRNDLDQFINKDIASIKLITDPLIDMRPHLGGILPYFNHFRIHSRSHIIDYSKEILFAHNHWDNIRRFAIAGGEVHNCTLYNTVNRVEFAKLFYSLFSTYHPNFNNNNFFNEEMIIQKFNTPGVVVFKAVLDGDLVGMMFFYMHNNNAYYHLMAQTEQGAKISAGYTLMYEAITFFRQIGIKYLNLGPDTGLEDDIQVSKFKGQETWKSGWANDERDSFVLGKVLDERGYYEQNNVGKRQISNYKG